ncbi:ATP-binding protein [Streptomyces sp. NBC_01233]|uniref:ATP-binding protein n=1 Tax=Streptomyces sp. NBC_01233 TaxID=2903787 RepID=UPI002E131C6B|nr:AAA family ATPase [Streptomyces sp. NBC_01233]
MDSTDSSSLPVVTDSRLCDARRRELPRPLLEREAELASLASVAYEAAEGCGSVTLIHGEAGIGKSSLVAALPQTVPVNLRLRFAYCHDLAAPRPLGPIRDLITDAGSASRLQDDMDAQSVLDLVLDTQPKRPGAVMVVIEDVHWADDATLDVLHYVVRRIAALPVALVLTYRDDVIDCRRRLSPLLGQVATTTRPRRVKLRPLSLHAVRQLSANSAIDAAQLYAATSGNPYLVTEVLSYGAHVEVPPSVADALLARTRRLEVEVRRSVEQLSVIPTPVEWWLAHVLLAGETGGLDAAEGQGLISVSPEGISFCHELTRQAIADSLPGARRMELNARVLAAMVIHKGVDLSRLLHHATEAGDMDAMAYYGPQAAREASRCGSHRQAVARYQSVLNLLARYRPVQQADLLQEYAVECYTIGQGHNAMEAQVSAVKLRRSLGDPRMLGTSLCWLSRMYSWNGQRQAAERTARQAIDVVSGVGDQRLLALAYSNQSRLHVADPQTSEGIEYGERALKLARNLGDRAIESHALTSMGTVQWVRGSRVSGRSVVEESLQTALAANEIEHACQAYLTLAHMLLSDLHLDEAQHYLTQGVKLAESREHLGLLGRMHMAGAFVAFSAGDWDLAVQSAERTSDEQCLVSRWGSLAVRGRVLVRRGGSGGEELLTRASDIAREIRDVHGVEEAAAGLAEAAWLRGDRDTARLHAESAYRWARQAGHSRPRHELTYWLIRMNVPIEMDGDTHPYALQAAGQWAKAAATWRESGHSYERAAALAETGHQDDLITALGLLEGLRAEPLTRIVRTRMRELGIHRAPRGPASTTRQNPHGLTRRQAEVTQLIRQGLTNAQIAAALVLSVRTVEQHVAAALAKLGVASRREVADRLDNLRND